MNDRFNLNRNSGNIFRDRGSCSRGFQAMEKREGKKEEEENLIGELRL